MVKSISLPVPPLPAQVASRAQQEKSYALVVVITTAILIPVVGKVPDIV
jgi:hypothetical protein